MKQPIFRSRRQLRGLLVSQLLRRLNIFDESDSLFLIRVPMVFIVFPKKGIMPGEESGR
jgi:hypothetical protein